MTFFAITSRNPFHLNENFAVDLGYRYLNLGTVKTDITIPAGPTVRYTSDNKSFASNHEIMLGLRYTF